MTIITPPTPQLVAQCEASMAKLYAENQVTDESPCNGCRDIMRGNCNSYGGCIYMDWQPTTTVEPDMAKRYEGHSELMKIGPSDGLSYLLTRTQAALSVHNKTLGELTRGWGVGLESLCEIACDSQNSPTVQVSAMYLMEQDNLIRNRTPEIRPEIKKIASSADPTVANYANDFLSRIDCIRSYQIKAAKNTETSLLAGLIFATCAYAGAAYLATDSNTTLLSALMHPDKLKLILTGLSGILGMSTFSREVSDPYG